MIEADSSEVLVYDGLQRCPYLPGAIARMPLYRQLVRRTPEQADERFSRAERRVGQALYHAACPMCQACQGIRVPVDTFRPSRSQRRAWRRWPETARVVVGPPRLTRRKLELFNRHKRERGLADAEDEPMTADGYMGWLVRSCFETVEMSYFFGERLVGVGIVDVGRTSASSVYFFFDPDPEVARYSPGVYSVLQEIEWCRETGRDHLYLGLYVEDCPQLAYKDRYLPHERLVDGQWRRFE